MNPRSGAHGEIVGGYGSQLQPEELLGQPDVREVLFDGLQQARAETTRIGMELAGSGVGDIAAHPDYQAAAQHVVEAEQAIRQFHGIE